MPSMIVGANETVGMHKTHVVQQLRHGDVADRHVRVVHGGGRRRLPQNSIVFSKTMHSRSTNNPI